MKTFSEYLQTNSNEGLVLEAFENLVGNDKDTIKKKNAYKKEILDLLRKSYESIGGIKGSGFQNEKDMVKNIWFWKLWKQDGHPAAVIMYKDRAGRKMVALGTDGSEKAKAAIKKMMFDEISLSRSYGEASGPALGMVRKIFGLGKNAPFEGSPLEKYMVPAEMVGDILKKPVKPVSKYEYIRAIGGDDEKKVMFGVKYKR